MARKIKQAAVALAIAAFWLLVWEWLSRMIHQEILLPAPMVVAGVLWKLWGTAGFWQAVGMSLLRVFGGFITAVAAGSLLAVATTRWRLVELAVSPVLHIVRAAPVASFIILAYFWIHLQILPAFIAFLMVVPLVWENVRNGIRQTDGRLLEMARVYRFGRWKTWRHVWVPSVRPYFEAACATGLGFAWKSGVAAEVICSPSFSVGKNLFNAKAYLDMPMVFAWTVTVVLLSVLMERILRRLIGRGRKVST